jgi:hypothetical protein
VRRIELLLLGCALALMAWTGSAGAYVGPGAGITMLGALWAVLVAVALTVGFILFWPVRVLLRRRRRFRQASETEPEPTRAAFDGGSRRHGQPQP